jgi:hypothetical protein
MEHGITPARQNTAGGSMTRSAVALVGVLAIAAAAPSARQKALGGQVERSFAHGGRIDLRLAAADYRIEGWSEDRIRVRWQSEDAASVQRVRADASVTGKSALVVTNHASHNMRFIIDVPQRSDLDVSLSAGDLDVRNVEGSKSVSSWAGDVSIDVGRADLYHSVDASVRVGDLWARPFNVSREGILRSFRWSGHGPYWLRVRLFAGDLTLK